MNSGWVKLHRKIRDSVVYTNSTALHVWVECLLRASHKEKSCYLKRQKLDLKPGQFVMGRDEFGKSIGISGSTAWYWILQFEVDSMVDIKKTAKGSIVSINRWNEHQKADTSFDNKRTTDEQQMNTNKNVKNDKNVKKKEYVPFSKLPTSSGKRIYPEAFEYIWNLYPNNANKSVAYTSWLKTLAGNKELAQKAVRAIHEQKKGRQWKEGIIPHFATWLNQERWEDEITETKKKPSFVKIS